MAEWFKGKEIAFAMGLNLSLARLGSVVNDVVSPAKVHLCSKQAACVLCVFLSSGFE